MPMSMRQFASGLNGEFKLTGDHSWSSQVEYANSHGLSGLFLVSPAARFAPDWVISLLRAAAHQVGERNLHRMEELGRVAARFERSGVPLMALKGAALNLTLYPRNELRPMSDVDLLVRPRHAVQAVQLLQECGYVSGANLIRKDFFPRFHYETEMIRPGLRPVRIDLHAHPWRPMHLAQVVGPETFWLDAQTIAIGDGNIQIPGHETMLIHLAAHAAFHGCSRLIWLYDLKQYVEQRGSKLRWDILVDQARKWQLTLAMCTGLEAAEQVLGGFVPQSIMAELHKTRPSLRNRLALWHAPRDASSPLLHVLCNTLCLRGPKAKLDYIRAMMTPDQRHLGESYPLRHAGWPVCAQLYRLGRNLGRACAGLFSPFHRRMRCGEVPT